MATTIVPDIKNVDSVMRSVGVSVFSSPDGARGVRERSFGLFLGNSHSSIAQLIKPGMSMGAGGPARHMNASSRLTGSISGFACNPWHILPRQAVGLFSFWLC
jgi:hypothetical protein